MSPSLTDLVVALSAWLSKTFIFRISVLMTADSVVGFKVLALAARASAAQIASRASRPRRMGL